MKRRVLVSFLVLLQARTAVASINRCAEALTGNAQIESVDASVRDLSRFRFNLDLARAGGSNSMVLTALAADYTRKENALIEYVEQNGILSRAQLFMRIREEIEQLQNFSAGADRIQNETATRRFQEEGIKKFVVDGRRAIFHRIEAGSFRMGAPGMKVDVTISKPFDMMATPVTQTMWKKVAVLVNEMRTPWWAGLIKRNNKAYIHEDPSRIKGDTRPLTNASYLMVQKWITKLNELSRAGEAALVDVIPDHQRGDIYRLPIEAEWAFVAEVGYEYDRLDDCAWHAKNSGDQTQPVGLKNGHRRDGHEFYDLLGNVWEMVGDKVKVDHPMYAIVARGNCSFDDPAEIEFFGRTWLPIEASYSGVGFRLVRNAR